MLIVTKVLAASGVMALAVAGPTPPDSTRDGQAVAASPPAVVSIVDVHPGVPSCINGCNLWQMMGSRSP
ncbi:MAG: hypothetical protein V4636_05720 [Pseudomonadota bacterium]